MIHGQQNIKEERHNTSGRMVVPDQKQNPETTE
jgi:hypothetical protein